MTPWKTPQNRWQLDTPADIPKLGSMVKINVWFHPYSTYKWRSRVACGSTAQLPCQSEELRRSWTVCVRSKAPTSLILSTNLVSSSDDPPQSFVLAPASPYAMHLQPQSPLQPRSLMGQPPGPVWEVSMDAILAFFLIGLAFAWDCVSFKVGEMVVCESTSIWVAAIKPDSYIGGYNPLILTSWIRDIQVYRGPT